MKRITTLLLSSLLLSSCVSLEERNITWMRVSHAELRRICANTAQHQNSKLLGCAVWSKNLNNHNCTIYTLDSLSSESPQEQFVLGHETMHCFKGAFHK